MSSKIKKDNTRSTSPVQMQVQDVDTCAKVGSIVDNNKQCCSNRVKMVNTCIYKDGDSFECRYTMVCDGKKGE